MYLNDYYEPGLSGKFSKRLKKLGKVAAHVGAAVMTGGASLAVSAAMIAAKKQKAAQAAAAAEAARQEQALLEALKAPPPIAPTQPVAPSLVKPGFTPAVVAPPPESYIQRDAAPAPMTMSTGQPPWLMPAILIGGGALLVTLMQRGGSRQ